MEISGFELLALVGLIVSEIHSGNYRSKCNSKYIKSYKTKYNLNLRHFKKSEDYVKVHFIFFCEL